MTWANPEYFWLLTLLPVLIGFHLWRYFTKRRTKLTFSSIENLKNLPGNWRVHLIWLSPLLYWAGFFLVTVALARPQLTNTTIEQKTEGIDIVMSIDISTSMRAEDIKPNRLEGAKELAIEFVDERISDRIGVVVFARQSFTVVPPTTDYRLVKEMIDSIHMGMVQDGTAIGMGIATAINRLRNSEAESKVIILLTDGMNNAGEIDPVTAAELAQSLGIKVYTLGIGTRGMAPFPIDDPIFGTRYRNVSVDIDEEMLEQIAALTGGQYFRATDTESFRQIYQLINEMEKTEVDEIIYTDVEDIYHKYLFPGIILCIFGFLGDRLTGGSLTI
ncbi:MAG: VWA domain-containing protein [Balneolaceae bacterium]